MKDVILGPQGLIIIGGILTLIGAFWSAKQGAEQEKLLNEKNETIITKTQENADLNERTVDLLTGGNSYPQLTFAVPAGFPIIMAKGEYAIQNVSGRILDIRQLRIAQREHGPTNGYNGFPFRVNILSPAYGDSINGMKIPMESGRYLVHYYTPYSTFQQRIAVEVDPDSGILLQAYKIFKGNDTTLIHTYYPDNFPIPLDEIDFLEIVPPEEMGPQKTAK